MILTTFHFICNMHFRQITLLILVFSFSAICQSFGQGNFFFQHLSIEHGISHNNITSITQDHDGYIWLGTTDGLNKYNSYSIQVYGNIKNDSVTGANSYIEVVYNDKQNNIWVGTSKGLSVYNKYSNSFVNANYKIDGQKPIEASIITAITEDKDGNIWAGTRHGLIKIKPNEPNAEFFLFEDTSVITGYFHNRICNLAIDSNNNIWVATLNGVHCMNLHDYKYQTYRKNPLHPELKDGRVNSLTCDKQGRVWIAYYDFGIMIYDPTERKFKTLSETGIATPLNSEKINRIYCDRNNFIWITNRYDGINRINLKTNELVSFRNDIYNTNSLADDKTTCIFEDKSGMMWFGTVSEGAERSMNRSEKFYSYLLEPGKPGSLCSKDILAFAEQKGKVWISSSSDVMLFDTATNTFKCISDSNRFNCLPKHSVNGIAVEPDGTIWFASQHGLSRYNSAEGCRLYTFDSLNKYSVPANELFDVIVRSDGTVLTASIRGLSKYNRKTDQWMSRLNDSTLNRLPRLFYYRLFEDSRKNIWIGTSNGGVLLCDSNLNYIEQFKIVKGNKNSMPDNTVLDIDEDKNGNMWFATQNGLTHFDPKNMIFTTFGIKSGFKSNYISSVKCDRNNSVWFTTHAGLSHIEFRDDKMKVFTLRNYTVADGIQSNAFNNASSILLQNGKMLFGGTRGFTVVPDDPIRTNDYAPQIQITSFKIYDNEFLFTEDWYNKKEIILNYDQRYFSFEMAAMNFNHPEQNQYAYQLVGFDDHMQYSGMRHYASYTNVPPGDYTLLVMASNNDGVWNKEGFKIKLIIVPPFWKTNWFLVLVAVAAIVIVYLFFVYRLRTLAKTEREKADINRRISEARIAALRAQMNPHFVFNSLNSIQHFIMENDKEGALKYLSKFSKLTRLVLRNANKNFNALIDELQILEWYLELEQLRFGGKFDYKIEVDQSIDVNDMEIPGMLLQPFVENSIIHGLLNKKEKGRVDILIGMKEAMLQCIIVDNGIGREAAMQIKETKKKDHESVGIKIAEERLNMLRKNLNRTTSIKFTHLKDEAGNALGTALRF